MPSKLVHYSSLLLYVFSPPPFHPNGQNVIRFEFRLNTAWIHSVTMKSTPCLPSRRFLLLQNASQPPATANDSTTITATAGTFNPTMPFDSSMALTILVLLTALFFMGFFSVYIRRFTAATEDSSPSPRRHVSPPTGHHKRGLDPASVASLPLAAYEKSVKHPMIEDCLICLGEFYDEETVKVIPYCGHVFHPRCLDTWLVAHVTCPLCRSAQLFKSCSSSSLEEEEVRLDVESGNGEGSSKVRVNETSRVVGSSDFLQRNRVA